MTDEQRDEEAVPVEEQPTPEFVPEQAAALPASEPKPAMAIAGIPLNQTQFPLFIVLVASIVLMIALGAHYEWKNNGVSSYAGYTISVASIAMILSFIGLILTKVNEGLYETGGMPMNGFCFVYSFVGACFITFNEPFTTTGNGYFATWAMVYASAMTLGMKAENLGSNIRGLGALVGLFASSLVVIIATITPIKDGKDKNEAVYAMVLACFSFAFVLLALGMDQKGRGMPGIGYFGALAILAICWVICACLVTFRGPFETTGNGYFASWAAAATCAMAAFAAKNDI